jgi:hypothetical protein
MEFVFIILLAVAGAAFIAGGIVGYRRSERPMPKAISAAAIAAGIVIWATVLFITPVFQQSSLTP